MAAKTITEAKRLGKSMGNSRNHANSCNKGILVCGLISNGILLTGEDRQLIFACIMQQDSGNVKSVQEIHAAFQYRSLFKPIQGVDGVLYRVGEDIIYKTSYHSQHTEEVARVVAFLSVLINVSYCTLAKIKLFRKLDDTDIFGELTNDCHEIVEMSNEVAFIAVTSVCRKVMLYPCAVDGA